MNRTTPWLLSVMFAVAVIGSSAFASDPEAQIVEVQVIWDQPTHNIAATTTSNINAPPSVPELQVRQIYCEYEIGT